MNQVRISIIVPVYNKVNYTRQCFDSLNRTLDLAGGKIEIIVVDNNSTDGTGHYLKDLPPCFKVIRNTINVGCGKAMNQGARIARGKYLVFLNNDTIALPGWLDELVKTVETEKNIGIAGCKLLFPDTSIQHGGAHIDRQLFVSHLFYRQPANLPQANEPRDCQAVTGACIIMKKEIFLEVGLFDGEYANSHLDIDICLKVRAHGYRVVYRPQSVLYHYESVSDGRHLHDNKDAAIFLKKWHNNFRPYLKRNKPFLTSIVIPCFNRVNFIRLCLENIFLYACAPYEIILVDNGSNDITREFLSLAGTGHRNIRIISNKVNTGYRSACIQGMGDAGGKYIMFMHTDAAVTEGWLCRMLSVGEAYGDVGVIGPVTNAVSGSQLVKGVPYNTETGMHSYAWQRAIRFERRGFYASRVSGFCMLAKKEVLHRLGRFDQNSNTGFEEELCLRAGKLGYKTAVLSDVFVHHFDGGTGDYPDWTANNHPG